MHVLIFNAILIYIAFVYFALIFSDPGRIESEREKNFVNERYKRLEKELELQKQEAIQNEDDTPGEVDVFKAPKRMPLFEDAFDNMLFNNSFKPSDVINYKMKDNREFKYCQKCNVYKCPRMHHCSQCNACCQKYDHHCGMLLNCIGVNNYHMFLQFMFLVALYFSVGLGLNVYYNFYLEYEPSKDYWCSVGITSLVVALKQIGCIFYSQNMLKWYFRMSIRGLNCVEESIAGEAYNKASYWGYVEKMGLEKAKY